MTATPLPTPTPTPAIESYVDPGGFSVGYPVEWRALTDEEIVAQLGGDESALASIRFVVLSPDGRANVSLIRVERLNEGESLDALAERLLDAAASSVEGFSSGQLNAMTLDGRPAIALSYQAGGTEQGDPSRQVRQIVTITAADEARVLSFVVQDDAAESYLTTFDAIEQSWRWAES